MNDDCFDDADSGDETCFVIALGNETTTARKRSVRSNDSWNQSCAEVSSPTGIQDTDRVTRLNSGSTTSQASSTMRSNRSHKSYSKHVSKSSSRSVAKSASRRMGMEECGQVLSTTVKNIRAPGTGPHQLELCSRTLRDLAAGVDGSIDMIVASGALEVVLERAPLHLAASPECTEQACRLLADVCEHSLVARDLVANSRAASFFCKVISQNISVYASVTESAVRAMGASCAFGHERNMELTREHSGIERILAAMRRWKEIRSLQSVALRAIEQTTEGSEVNQAELSDYGGLQEIVSTMLYFAEDSRLQGYALSALISVCRSDESSREALGEAGAIQSVTSALSMFTTRLDIASYGALAVRYLCMNATNRQRFREGNGMEILINSLQSIAKREREVGNLPHMDGIAHCLLALESASNEHELNKDSVKTPSSVAIISHAASMYVHEVGISEHTMRLLRTLYAEVDDSEQRRQRGGGGIARLFAGGMGVGRRSAGITSFFEVCVRILMKHVVHESIVVNVCVFFCSALDYGHERDVVGHELFPELQDEIRKAVEIHSGAEGVAGEAIELFSRLRAASSRV